MLTSHVFKHLIVRLSTQRWAAYGSYCASRSGPHRNPIAPPKVLLDFVSLHSTPKSLPSLEISNAAVRLLFTGLQTDITQWLWYSWYTSKMPQQPWQFEEFSANQHFLLLPTPKKKKICLKCDNIYQADKFQLIIWLSGLSFWYKKEKFHSGLEQWHSSLVSAAKLHTVLLEIIIKKSMTKCGTFFPRKQKYFTTLSSLS